MRTLLRGLIAVVLLFPSFRAEAAPGVRFFADAGVVLPTGPAVFDELWQPSVGIGAGAEYGLSDTASLWGRLDYARFALDEGEANGAFYTQGPAAGVSGGDLTIWGLQAGVRLRPVSGLVRPYLDLGAGVRTIDADDIEVSYFYWQTGERMTYDIGFVRETRLAFSAGLGLLYTPRASFGLFADAHIDVMLTEGERTHFVPLRVGVLFP